MNMSLQKMCDKYKDEGTLRGDFYKALELYINSNDIQDFDAEYIQRVLQVIDDTAIITEESLCDLFNV
jgi:transposase